MLLPPPILQLFSRRSLVSPLQKETIILRSKHQGLICSSHILCYTSPDQHVITYLQKGSHQINIQIDVYER